VHVIASGDAHTCAIVADGGVRCWGSNMTGQAGRPVVDSSPKPVVITGVSDATAAASGETHTCALRADGTVVCWGRNVSGQLGRGWESQGSIRGAPVLELPRTTAVASGAQFSCALAEDGTVRCWGSNARGQLGDGTTRSSSVAVEVRGVSGATAIGAGVSQACA